MEQRNYPETFESSGKIIKKTAKKYWLQILASLMCFGSTGINIGNTIKYLNAGKAAAGVATIVFATITFLLACANAYLFYLNYQRIKNQVD